MPSGCYFGAIRWDAWYANTGPAVSTARALGSSDLQPRAPFFAEVLSTNAIRYAPTEATMSFEISMAVAGGLSYWAFLLYNRSGQDADMMAGYDLFQANPNKNNIKWCQIRDVALWGTTGNFATQVAEALAMCQQPNYQMVLTNRPLVYIYGGTAHANFGGSDVNFKAALDAFRSACTGAGLGNPYIVVLGGAAATSHAARVAWGCDAISNYISNFTYNALPSTYAKLDADAQAFWAQMAATGSDIVPICMTGWDSTARKRRPVNWALTTQQPWHGMNRRFIAPTQGELIAHLQAAATYVNANPTICDSKAILVYAWNENDESGTSLVPTLGDPTGTLIQSLGPTMAF